MNRVDRDIAWRLLTTLVVDILNPTLVISFALFVSVGYIVTLLMPVTIEIWLAVFCLTLLLPLPGLVVLAGRKWKKNEISAKRFSWRVLLPLVPLLVLAPSFYVEFTSPPFQLMSHGDIHSSYVYQLLYGVTPPEHAFLAGFPANYYWLFHALLATLVKITSLSLGQVSSMVLVAAIFSGLMWLAQILVLLRLAKPRTIYLGCLTLAAYCALNLTGFISLSAYVLSAGELPDLSSIGAMRVMLLDGADHRLFSTIDKMLELSSMTLGMTAFLAVLYSCVRMLVGKLDLLLLILISAGGLLSTAVQQVVTLYIVVVLLAGVVLTVAIYALRKQNGFGASAIVFRDILGGFSPFLILLWFAFSASLALPLLKYIRDLNYNSIGAIRFGLLGNNNIAMIIAGFALLLPFYFVQWFYVLKRENRLELYFQVCTTLALGVTTVLALPHWNQYKGAYCLSVVIAISTLFVLRMWQQSDSKLWRYFGWMLAMAFFVLVIMKLIYLGYFYVEGEIHKEIDGIEYDGIHIEYHSEILDQRTAAYFWIRDNSPYDAVVVTPLYISRFSNVVYERLPFVKRNQYIFTSNIDAYDYRVQQLSIFYDDGTTDDEYKKLLSDMESQLPGIPFYAVVKDTEVGQQTMLERRAKLVYNDQNNEANVYLLNPDSETS